MSTKTTKSPKKKAAAEALVAATEAEIVVESIKGFDQNLRCRGFQFEVGKTYEVAGHIEACRNGFHACPVDEHPLSVFDYYGPASRFALVSQSGDTDKDGNKLASAKITINAEISLGDLTKRAIDWVFARAKWKEGPHVTGDNEAATASGDQGAATASGDQGAATASGDQGAATASGDQGAATASGYKGAATASGDQGAATASGYKGAATASGYKGAATASGTRGAATASGKASVAIAPGWQGRARGVEGAAICLVNRDDDGNMVAIRASKVGDNGVKPNVWYSLNADGEFVEEDA